MLLTAQIQKGHACLHCASIATARAETGRLDRRRANKQLRDRDHVVPRLSSYVGLPRHEDFQMCIYRDSLCLHSLARSHHACTSETKCPEAYHAVCFETEASR